MFVFLFILLYLSHSFLQTVLDWMRLERGCGAALIGRCMTSKYRGSDKISLSRVSLAIL